VLLMTQNHRFDSTIIILQVKSKPPKSSPQNILRNFFKTTQRASLSVPSTLSAAFGTANCARVDTKPAF